MLIIKDHFISWDALHYEDKNNEKVKPVCDDIKGRNPDIGDDKIPNI